MELILVFIAALLVVGIVGSIVTHVQEGRHWADVQARLDNAADGA